MFVIAEIFLETRGKLEDIVLTLINFVEKVMSSKTKIIPYL